MTSPFMRTSAAVFGLASLLLLSSCSDAGTGGAAAPSSAPATAPTAAGAAGASAPAVVEAPDAPSLAASVALKPQEWAAGFVPGQPYEVASLAERMVDTSCEYVPNSQGTGRIGTMARTVRRPAPAGGAATAVNGRSTADVYVRAEDAHEAVAALRTDARRCQEVVDKQYGRTYRATREVAPPRTTAADEVYAEEGQTAALGAFAEFPFVHLAARKGSVVVDVFVEVEQGQGVAAAREQSRTVLAALLAKLPKQ
ncbi:hypothetical protein [Kitasatospora sp. NPDC085879]|uniref:hypothetical protein n=1 Tax=Kitasatospora sp. NPDC085879 TaxID=3154769 RepID=UPI003426288E